MKNHYQVLGIPRGASPQLVKMAYEGKMKALDDPKFPLAPEVRREEERALRDAYVTLSVDLKRDIYDQKLDAWLEKEADAAAARPKGKISNSRFVFASIIAAVVMLGIGAQGFQYSKEKEAQRVAAAEAAAKREEATRRAEAEAERVEEDRERRKVASEQARLRSDEYRQTRETERWRAQTDAQIRYNERSAMAQQVVDAALDSRAAYEQRVAEDRARRQEEAERYAAMREVERQKQYLRQQEAEEERIRREREYRARAEYNEIRMREQREKAIEAYKARN